MSADYPLVWFWRPHFMRPVDRKGQPCRILARGKMNSVLVEFADGFCVVTSRYATRRRAPSTTAAVPEPGATGETTAP